MAFLVIIWAFEWFFSSFFPEKWMQSRFYAGFFPFFCLQKSNFVLYFSQFLPTFFFISAWFCLKK